MMNTYWLAPFPVLNKHVPLYGRGRSYFPQPIEFTVPVLCATTTHPSPLFYFIVDVAPEWENWKLALPQSADNNVLCFTEPVSAQGTLDKDRGSVRGYRVFTVAELRRRMPSFWRQTVVLMNKDSWLPMDCADPFNLLGFTCLPTKRTADLQILPEWSTVSQTTLAIATIKPNYLAAPLNTTQLKSYKPVPADAPAANDGLPKMILRPAVFDAFLTPMPMVEVTLKKVYAEPTLANVRDYMRWRISKKQAIDLRVTAIEDAYYWNDQNRAYLCDIKGLDEPVWVAENLLESMEIKDSANYLHYQRALEAFEKTLNQEE